jgi:uncharacterized protein YciI
MKHFILFYDYRPDYLEARVPLRPAHMREAFAAVDRGEMVLAGAFADPADGGALVFEGEDRSVAENFARTDPYVTSGLVTSWRVREWTTVIGDLASSPVPRPA